MYAINILKKSCELVSSDRSKQHGDIVLNHKNIAKLWTGYLWEKIGDNSVSASDVANMMELLKVARRKLGDLNTDDYVDGAGYAAVAYECKKEEE